MLVILETISLIHIIVFKSILFGILSFLSLQLWFYLLTLEVFSKSKSSLQINSINFQTYCRTYRFLKLVKLFWNWTFLFYIYFFLFSTTVSSSTLYQVLVYKYYVTENKTITFYIIYLLLSPNVKLAPKLHNKINPKMQLIVNSLNTSRITLF